jgi:hypothetical protein
VGTKLVIARENRATLLQNFIRIGWFICSDGQGCSLGLHAASNQEQRIEKVHFHLLRAYKQCDNHVVNRQSVKSKVEVSTCKDAQGKDTSTSMEETGPKSLRTTQQRGWEPTRPHRLELDRKIPRSSWPEGLA